MSDNNDKNLIHGQDMRRRRFLTGAGLAVAGASIAAASNAAAQSGQSPSGFTPERHALDSWMDSLGGRHRAFVDSSTGPGGIAAVNFAANILNSHAQGYGGSDEDYGMIVCFRHASAPYGFNDAMWAKYHDVFVGRTGVSNPSGESVTVNPLTGERTYGNRGNSLANMSGRGVHFAVCNLSTQGMAGMIARAQNRASDEVYAELVANLIPNGQLVPSGVIAATRAQEYGYSFMYAYEEWS